MGFIVSKRPMFGGNSGFVVPDYRIRTVSGYPPLLKKPLELRRMTIYGNEGGVPAGDLPKGYRALEYIESTGSQFINTGFTPGAGKFKMTCKIQTTEVPTTNTYLRVFGNAATTTTVGVYRFQYRGYNPSLGAPSVAPSCGGMTRPETRVDPWVEYAVYNLSVNGINNKFTINNKSYSYAYEKPENLNEVPIYLFRSGIGNSSCSAMRMFDFKIENADGNVVLNMVPALRDSDDTVGMYDTVNGIFYTNSGSGEFIAEAKSHKIQLLFGENRIVNLYSIKGLGALEHIEVNIANRTAALATDGKRTDISSIQDWSQDFTFSGEEAVTVTADTAVTPLNIEIKYKGKRR